MPEAYCPEEDLVEKTNLKLPTKSTETKPRTNNYHLVNPKSADEINTLSAPDPNKTFRPKSKRMTKEEIENLIATTETLSVENVEDIILAATAKGWIEPEEEKIKPFIHHLDEEVLKTDKAKFFQDLNNGELGYIRGPKVNYVTMTRSRMINRIETLVQALHIMDIKVHGVINAPTRYDHETEWRLYYEGSCGLAAA